jgi:SP family general alpha glucoside:H+ symporter-like MFS transporter
MEDFLEKNGIVHVERDGGKLPSDETTRLAELLQQARRATESEHKMTVWQAVKRYPKASAWSTAISLGVVMEGKSLGLGLPYT